MMISPYLPRLSIEPTEHFLEVRMTNNILTALPPRNLAAVAKRAGAGVPALRRQSAVWFIVAACAFASLTPVTAAESKAAAGPQPRIVAAAVPGVGVAARPRAGVAAKSKAIKSRTVATAAPRVAVVDNPAGFMTDLGARAMATSNANATPGARKAQIVSLMRDNFDFKSIGRFALGRHWDRATVAQQAEFQSVYGDYSVGNYADQLGSLQITSMKVMSTRPSAGSDVVVETVMERRRDRPATFDWRLSAASGQPRVVDVTVDGVSLAVTQRDEMNAFVTRNGLPALIAQMKQQVAAAN